MRKFLFKCAVFVLLLGLVPAVELFLLPPDLFNFRVWESITTPFNRFGFGPGFFYPGKHIRKLERGDHENARWNDPEPVQTEWWTDSHGFRNRPEVADLDSYFAVTIGDSHIAGSHLDQANTLAVRLSALTGKPVYNYGGNESLTLKFFNDPRWKKLPVRYVIIEARPVSFGPNGPLRGVFTPLPDGSLRLADYAFPPKEANSAQAELEDRLLKQNWLQFLRSRLKVVRMAPEWPAQSAPVALAQASAAASAAVPAVPAAVVELPPPPKNEVLDFAFKAVMAVKTACDKRGSRFIFLLMPSEDRSLDTLPHMLKNAGVKVLACVPGDDGFPCPENLGGFYSTYDTHWTPKSVEYTAERLRCMLSE
ncbi:MAG: hypothetical protein P4L39_02345 [Humidesulfovibrio sp.]|nr:hypothetical protein [Humidesulfovibrio sp.]